MDNPTPLPTPSTTRSWQSAFIKFVLIGFGVFLIIIVSWYLFSTYLQPKIKMGAFDIKSTPALNASRKDFSVIVLPDTQKYSVANSPIFCQQTQWIVDKQKERNIVFVSHLGDIVDSGAQNTKEWELASKCMGKLDGKIPYGIIPGNHDVDNWNRNKGVTIYDKYFPASRYSKYSWYKGNRKENQNNYQLISIDTDTATLVKSRADAGITKSTSVVDLIFLNLEIEPSNNTITWANEIAKKYPSAYIILTTHKYLPDDTPKRDADRAWSDDGNTGEDIWNKLVKDNCNIRMVWSGHFHKTDGENRIVSTNSCGQEVQEILQDYQDRENGGNGLLRIYTFNPSTKNIEVQTYSPYTQKFEEDESSHFTLPFAM